MDCALWLNRKKISEASEISENLDIASLRGYFLAGSLVPWLNEHGGKRYAKRLTALSLNDPLLNDKIARIFGGSVDTSAPYKVLDGDSPDVFGFSADNGSMIGALTSFDIGSAGSYNYAALSSFGIFYNFMKSFLGAESGSFMLREYLTSFSSASSFNRSEWEWLWQLLFSGQTSFAATSGSFTYGWEWLWNLIFSGQTSFSVTSGGSFAYGWEWLWNLLFGGSTSFGVTSVGSFTYGWEWLHKLLFGRQGSFSSFDWSAFGFGSFGSFDFGIFDRCQNAEADNLPAFPHLDEYDLVLLKTLISCPLDRFGYGIHNI